MSWGRRFRPAAATGMAALAILGLVASSRGPVAFAAETREATMPGDGFAWRLFFTADTRGYIHPCGCSEGLFGGFPRRATYLAKARKPGDLLIDLGNLIEGTRPHERLKLGYVLEGLKQLEYDVLVPGEGELALGEDFEKAVSGLARPKVVCANLVRARTKERVFQPWSLHKLPDGRTAAVVGVTSPYQTLPSCYAVTDPAASLKEALASLKGKADRIVVAAYLEGKPALDLAAEFPNLSAVLGGRVPAGSPDVLKRGGAPLMLGGERGQYVAWLGFNEATATRGGLGWLPDGTRDDPQLAGLVARHDRDVARFGPTIAEQILAAFRSAGRLGSEACRECHKAEYEIWARSKHAHAMQALRGKGQHENPHCMDCHLQDLADAGWREVGGAGCESCHAGAADHVTAARAGAAAGPGIHKPQETCVRCHDKANSPHFDYSSYWGKIAHGVREGSVR